MELRQIKELMAAMRRHGTKKLKYEAEGESLELEAAVGHVSSDENAPVSREVLAQAKDIPAAGGTPRSKQADSSQLPKNSYFVTSPIVGTFYLADSPDSPPFVKPGDQVQSSKVICIIEAMKVMNEVKAGVDGIVEEVLVENAHPVEFGTKMFRIRTTG